MVITPEIVVAALAVIGGVTSGILAIWLVRAKQASKVATQPGDNLADIIQVLNLSFTQSQSQHTDYMRQASEDRANLKNDHAAWRQSFDASTTVNKAMTTVLESSVDGMKGIGRDIAGVAALIGGQEIRMATMEHNFDGLQNSVNEMKESFNERFETMQAQLSDERIKKLLEEMRQKLLGDVQKMFTDAIAAIPGTGNLQGRPDTGPDAARSPVVPVVAAPVIVIAPPEEKPVPPIEPPKETES